MLRKVHIKNFKSISDLELDLGRINVFIGENGSGKSNILEALAFASAAANDKLDNEFLATRGIRMTEPEFMMSAFPAHDVENITINLVEQGREKMNLVIESRRDWTSPWSLRVVGILGQPIQPGENEKVFELLGKPQDFDTLIAAIKERRENLPIDLDTKPSVETLDSLSSEAREKILAFGKIMDWVSEMQQSRAYRQSLCSSFLSYSPNASAIRTFEVENQILPLGIRGEGLFKLLKHLEANDQEGWQLLKKNLHMLDWLDDIEIAKDLSPYEKSIRIKDRFLDAKHSTFDQRSANEAFLFLLFYLALFISKDTPTLFAIDNVDVSLNPKMCSELMHRLTILAEAHGKQALLTTHSPSILDGMNLHDDEQRLFVVSRNRQGHTKVKRIGPPKPIAGEPPVMLSEAFVRGLLGGLPKNF